MRKLQMMLVTISFSACYNFKVDCEAAAMANRETECLLIFESLPVFGQRSLNTKGKHLKTKDNCECNDDGGWWTQYEDYLEKGDTIIKKKGELIFSIHKKDTVLHFNWECEGKIYK